MHKTFKAFAKVCGVRNVRLADLRGSCQCGSLTAYRHHTLVWRYILYVGKLLH